MKKLYLLIEHLPITFFVIFCYQYFEITNLFYFFLILFFGWLIDLDHLIDYLIFIKKLNKKFSIKFFLTGKYFVYNKKIYLFLHSYEISIILVIFSLIEADVGFLFVAISHICHLIQDQLSNNVQKYTYFLIYRILVKFNYQKICRN